MAHTYAAHGTRQTTVFTAIIALHFGVFLAIVAGPPIHVAIVPPWKPGPVTILPKPPPPIPVRPGKPEPYEGVRTKVDQPDIDILVDDKVQDAPIVKADPVAPGTSAGSGPVDYQPASLRTRDQRVAALIGACYPAASRRLDEEGRAIARIVLDAQGKVMSWSLHSGSGFARLDAALGCVLKHFEFQPARRDGQAVAATIDLPIAFRLN
jgi:protein TonB